MERGAKTLFLQVLAEEVADLAEGFAYFGNAIVPAILRVRLAFVDLQEGLDSQLAQLAMHMHCVAEQQDRKMAGEAWVEAI